ncbi:MAG: Alkaline phosphatase [Planctomycetaceae bacterium]|nr:Alkaline phosphatase [Planctomycetaceae bacterium]
MRLLFISGVIGALLSAGNVDGNDWVRDLQARAIREGKSPLGHWGKDPENYTAWGSHSNRLIPVYTFGTRGAADKVRLESYSGVNSLYRNAAELRRLYGRMPDKTLNQAAEYLDQTNLYDLQLAAAAAGKKQIFLVVFDGMDWQTTRAAAIQATQSLAYSEGRGTGLHWLDYTAGDTSEYGFMVTSPHNEGTDIDVNGQAVKNVGGKIFGGYDPHCGGDVPWKSIDLGYLIGKPAAGCTLHAYTDSSSSATSMTAGIKTFNGAVNVDHSGAPVNTIAHILQRQGWLVGAVSSVPISHATPAATYAHNVERDDYQDLTRDLLGLKSISHPVQPLDGLDVLIGGGYGHVSTPATHEAIEKLQGKNFVPGNVYLTQEDARVVDLKHGGKYLVATREAGKPGAQSLRQTAEQAAKENRRLLGFYGNGKYNGHLPFATADGEFNPTMGRAASATSPSRTEFYTPADLVENPTLAEMTEAAITALARPEKKFWVLVEAGDVDWANHDNNIDNSIGAVKSGDKAVKVITDWVEKNSNWKDALVIVTADHGHLLVLERPELLVTPKN